MIDTGLPSFGRRDPEVEYQDRRAAYAVIFRDGLVATVKNARGGYFLPGGGAEVGETPEQTVLREIGEELGCGARLIRRLGEAEQFFFAASDDKHYRMRAVFFVAELTSGPQDSDVVGEEQWCYLSVEEARERLYHACHVWAISCFPAVNDRS